MSRRRFVFSVASAAVVGVSPEFALAASDFWNKKDPSSWTSEDIRLLVTKSPWAKDVRFESRTETPASFDGSAPVGSGLPGDPGTGLTGQQIGGPRMSIPLGGNAADQAGGGNMPGDRGPGAKGIPIAAETVTVRWESAQPILEALKTTLPEDLTDRYVISVSGLSIPPAERPGMPERLKNSSFLQAKGKKPAQPGVVRYARDGAVLLFGFSKEFLSLTAADKDVQFSINNADFSLRARFEPREMMYRGQLAL